MTGFERLAGMARRAVDRVHGETVTLKPFARGRGPHGAISPDAIRAEAAISAAFFSDTERQARDRARPSFGNGGDRLVHRSPEILASITSSSGAQVGDRIFRIKTGVTYEITTRDPDDVGNLIVGLAVIKGT